MTMTNTPEDAIRTSSAAYLLAVGEAAIRSFAQDRAVDLDTLIALQREAVTTWAHSWGCDMADVDEQAARAGALLTCRPPTAPAPGVRPLWAC